MIKKICHGGNGKYSKMFLSPSPIRIQLGVTEQGIEKLDRYSKIGVSDSHSNATTEVKCKQLNISLKNAQGDFSIGV